MERDTGMFHGLYTPAGESSPSVAEVARLRRHAVFRQTPMNIALSKSDTLH